MKVYTYFYAAKNGSGLDVSGIFDMESNKEPSAKEIQRGVFAYLNEAFAGRGEFVLTSLTNLAERSLL